MALHRHRDSGCADAAEPEPGFEGVFDAELVHPGRRFLVFDADGELVATFPTWDKAHAWSHLRAAEPLTMLPIRIEDHCERRTWTVDAEQCRMTVWRRQVEYRICLPEQAMAPARMHLL
jgi:hypothetical protein